MPLHLVKIVESPMGFPRVVSPRGKSDYPRDLPWKIVPVNPQGFPLFFRLLD